MKKEDYLNESESYNNINIPRTDNQSESGERAKENPQGAIYRLLSQLTREREGELQKMKSFVLISAGEGKVRLVQKPIHVGLLQKHISSRYIFVISTTTSFFLSLFLSPHLDFLSHISKLARKKNDETKAQAPHNHI